MDTSHFFSEPSKEELKKEVGQLKAEVKKKEEYADTLERMIRRRKWESEPVDKNELNEVINHCLKINESAKYNLEIKDSESVIIFITELVKQINKWHNIYYKDVEPKIKEKNKEIERLKKDLSYYKDLYHSIDIKNNQSNDINYIKPKEMEITLSDIIKIKQLIELKVPYRKISQQTGWSTFTISRIKNGHYDKYL